MKWALICLLTALVAWRLGFTGVARGAVSKVLFFIFLIIFIVIIILAISANQLAERAPAGHSQTEGAGATT